MNPDCKLYDPDKNHCNHFNRGNVPVEKVCGTCQYRQSYEVPQEKPAKGVDTAYCKAFYVDGDEYCFNAKAGIWRNRAAPGICDECNWPDGSLLAIYDEPHYKSE